jgi:hypothetical protein
MFPWARVDEAPVVVFTIGHSIRSKEEFIILKAHAETKTSGMRQGRSDSRNTC